MDTPETIGDEQGAYCGRIFLDRNDDADPVSYSEIHLAKDMDATCPAVASASACTRELKDPENTTSPTKEL